MRIQNKIACVLYCVLSASVCICTSRVFAAPDSVLSQQITSSSITTDILSPIRVPVQNPSVAMSNRAFSFDCYSGGNASTGTFGSDAERIYVTNPGAATNGWSLTLAASSPTDVWQGQTPENTFDFNDNSGSGCSDSGDADASSGLMTIDPSVGTLVSDCTECTLDNIVKGSSNSFVQGVTDTITLMSAGPSADTNGQWYLTDVSVKQSIPAETPVDTYSIDLTLTVTAS